VTRPQWFPAAARARLERHRAVRDSKDPTGPALTFTAAEWSAFTAGIRADELG
jgi:hypothetical protein